MRIRPTTIAVLSIVTLAIAGVAYASTSTPAKQGSKTSVAEPAGQEVNDQVEAKTNKAAVDKPDATKDAETNDDGQATN